MAPVRLKHITLPFILKSLFIFLLLAASGGYIVFQSRLLIEGPYITLASTQDGITHDHTVTVSGTVHNATALTLDGRPIDTDETGHFNESLVLEGGYTIMTLRAHDRFGRTTSISEPFIYAPTTN